MGAFLECRVEKDFPKVEISKEISNENNKNNNDKEKTKNILKEKRNKKNKNLGKEKIEEDDMIIINTDEEKSNNGKEINIKKMTNNNKNKKINNTIFINNSNVTIDQRKENKLKDDLNEIKNDFNFNNEDNIELDEILSNVFNNDNKINNKNNFFTESDIDYNYSKEYFDQLYTEQSQINLDINPLNENDEKIIKKLNQLKEKINNKNKPKEKNKKHNFRFEFNPIKVHRTISMTNKQIKKNIPSYRKNQGIFNSISFNNNHRFRKFKVHDYSNGGLNHKTSVNSFNKSLYSSLMGTSIKENIYNFSNNTNEDLYIKNSRGTPSFYSMHKSYLNNSSINQTSSNGINSQSKYPKNKNLYTVVSKRLKKKAKPKVSQNKNSKIKENLISKFDIKKEIENEEKNNNNILYHKYRDIIEIFLPNNFNKESVINNKIYTISETNNNKGILNYNKLNNLKTSIILYDGILHKVTDKKIKGFKLSKRYFQITKNCFRYYNSLENVQKEEKPLVQFDIRHIKDLQIIENDFLGEYKIDNKDIEMVFCIYLNQNNDFFVFAVNNENFGKSVFNVLNLLKNYYEDKK